MIRIGLVDDHPAFRDSFRHLLERESDLSVVAVAGDGLAAIELVKQHQPDVVVTDVRLPRMDGLEATREIATKHPGTKVVVMTLFTDDGTRVKALEAGAHHCLAKESNFQGMLAAIRGCRNSNLQNALSDVLRSRIRLREKVSITELPGPVKAFEIKASLRDYNTILSQIDVIRKAAMKFAGMPEEEGFVINLVLNEESLYRH